MSEKSINPIDTHVGQRLRQRRLLSGLTQEKLAEAVGVSFQMIQKYEKGSCRVGASRLMQLAKALGVSASYFFDESPSTGTARLRVAENKNQLDEGVMTKKETIDLLKAYYALPEDVRKHVLGMVKGLKQNG